MQYLPAFLGLAYAGAGLTWGVNRGLGTPLWPTVIAWVAAVAAGWWAAQAGLAAQGRGRLPLLAAGFVIPVAMMPQGCQPIGDPLFFQLLALALIIDVACSLSRSTPRAGADGSRPHHQRAGLHLGATLALYGGAALLALFGGAPPWPALLWLAVGMCLALGVNLVRLWRPTALHYQGAARWLLWGLVMSTTVAVGWTVLFPLERAPSPGLALGAALYFRLALSVVRRLARQKTEALPRVALATIMVAATTAAATHVALLPGTVSQSALTVTVATVALCSPLAAWWLAGQLPPRVVPRLGRTVSAIITTPSGATGTAELLQDLYPLTKLFPQGDLALVSLLDGSVGILQRTGEVTLHSAPLAEPLGDLLHRHASPLPMPARPVLGRAVRVPALRPLATVIEQVGARLIVPLPGGLEGGWAGALLIATPRRPTLWGELAPPLLRLARHLGPQLHASVALDQVSRRLGETEREQSRLQQESDRISRKLEGAQEENRLLRAARRQSQKIEIIGTSRAVQQLREELVEVASLPTSVTLVGEIGTGRALLARFVHDKSPQHHGPLVQFDCAANPPRMHRHALLCGATQDEVGLGLIELAHQGTLLLENVENLSTEAQDELNQVLATGEVCRPGPLSMRPVRLRVVATTGQQLDEGDLLPDLAARLATVTLSVPPLRARAEDIPELIQFFQERLAQRRGVVPGTWTEEALNELGRCSWPGNVRQLRAVVESAVFAANGGDVRREDLPPPLAPPPPRAAPRAAPPAPEAAAFDGTFHEIEERILHHVLAVTDGNKAEAARRLGLKRTTLASRLRKHGL